MDCSVLWERAGCVARHFWMELKVSGVKFKYFRTLLLDVPGVSRRAIGLFESLHFHVENVPTSQPRSGLVLGAQQVTSV